MQNGDLLDRWNVSDAAQARIAENKARTFCDPFGVAVNGVVVRGTLGLVLTKPLQGLPLTVQTVRPGVRRSVGAKTPSLLGQRICSRRILCQHVSGRHASCCHQRSE